MRGLFEEAVEFWATYVGLIYGVFTGLIAYSYLLIALAGGGYLIGWLPAVGGLVFLAARLAVQKMFPKFVKRHAIDVELHGWMYLLMGNTMALYVGSWLAPKYLGMFGLYTRIYE